MHLFPHVPGLAAREGQVRQPDERVQDDDGQGAVRQAGHLLRVVLPARAEILPVGPSFAFDFKEDDASSPTLQNVAKTVLVSSSSVSRRYCCFPCINCSLRTKAIEDKNNYICCQGYFDCMCFKGGSVGTRAVTKLHGAIKMQFCAHRIERACS